MWRDGHMVWRAGKCPIKRLLLLLPCYEFWHHLCPMREPLSADQQGLDKRKKSLWRPPPPFSWKRRSRQIKTKLLDSILASQWWLVCGHWAKSVQTCWVLKWVCIKTTNYTLVVNDHSAAGIWCDDHVIIKKLVKVNQRGHSVWKWWYMFCATELHMWRPHVW